MEEENQDKDGGGEEVCHFEEFVSKVPGCLVSFVNLWELGSWPQSTHTV